MLIFDMIIHRHRWALGGAITYLTNPIVCAVGGRLRQGGWTEQRRGRGKERVLLGGQSKEGDSVGGFGKNFSRLRNFRTK